MRVNKEGSSMRVNIEMCGICGKIRYLDKAIIVWQCMPKKRKHTPSACLATADSIYIEGCRQNILFKPKKQKSIVKMQGNKVTI